MVTKGQRKYILDNPDAPANAIAVKTGISVGDIEKVRAESGQRGSILAALKRKSFFPQLAEQFTDKEITFFCEQWILIFAQFGNDVLPSEELQLKEMISFEILKNRLMAENKKMQEISEEARQQLRRELRMEPDERDKDLIRMLKETVSEAVDTVRENTRAIRDFSDRSSKLQISLNASRQQRTEDIEQSKFDFVALLKVLQDHELRNRVGKEMEMVRIAREKSKQKLGALYEYANKELDRPILTEETVKWDEDTN